MRIFAGKRNYAKDIRIFRICFFFYSNEHGLIHVHVMKGEEDTVFYIILADGELAELRRRSGKRMAMNEKDAKDAEAFVRQYYKSIVKKWINFFVLKKAVRSTKITKKIK